MQRHEMTVRWSFDDRGLSAVSGHRDVARHQDGTGLPPARSPRPFLHPISSLAGVLLTEVEPTDHPHHLGVSMAIADVDGVTYWGGPSFVRDEGYAMLDNHGTQTVVSQELRGGRLDHEVQWTAPTGVVQLRESRATTLETSTVPTAIDEVRTRTGEAAGAVLRVVVSSTLRSTSGVVTIGSPATNGRAGIGYGGLFWRMPHGTVETVWSPAGAGEHLANGSSGAWVAFVLADKTGPASLLFRRPAGSGQDAERPWFVRADEYPGVGLAVASSTVTQVDPEHPLTTTLEAVVVDGRLDAPSAAALHRALTVSREDAA
ncbi:PmoA family protein [Plantibacter flavus]|uniref:DUF6807 family protein n=1 Tax=Plantibacter flavus TaxID=150123 RepID=UPI003F1382D5